MDIYKQLGIPDKAVRRAIKASLEELSVENRQFFAEHRFFNARELSKMFEVSKKDIKSSRLFWKIDPVKLGKSLMSVFVYIGDDGGYTPPNEEPEFSNIFKNGVI
ncbi:MAG: hypothetical protein PHU64_07725 [Candidatus Omnitrophica bacterium]|nr:hypothetical protein [Candidatus Omnitrophota bacterium]